MYRIYHPILKFYQMLRVVPRHNPIREIFHNPIRNSYRMIRTIPSVIPAYPTSVQTSTCKPVLLARLCASLPVPINLNLHTRRRRYIYISSAEPAIILVGRHRDRYHRCTDAAAKSNLSIQANPCSNQLLQYWFHCGSAHVAPSLLPVRGENEVAIAQLDRIRMSLCIELATIKEAMQRVASFVHRTPVSCFPVPCNSCLILCGIVDGSLSARIPQ